MSAFAQAANLPFKLALGDDVATVKSKLGTNIDPEPMPRNPALPAAAPDMNRGKTILHLRTKGVWAFFDRNGKLETIRFDAPFDGDVRGVKLGDDDNKLIATIGKPITKPTSAFMNMQAYKYVWDDSAYLTFDLNDDGVQYIFITKIPGEILFEEFLHPMEISQTKLANSIGVPPGRINEIVLDKRGITADTALRLAKVLRTSQRLSLFTGPIGERSEH